jgi:hypothetical protein
MPRNLASSFALRAPISAIIRPGVTHSGTVLAAPVLTAGNPSALAIWGSATIKDAAIDAAAAVTARLRFMMTSKQILRPNAKSSRGWNPIEADVGFSIS